MERISVGQRLKEIMQTQRLRQVDILNKTLPYQKSLNIHMSKSHLSNYVNDRSNPDSSKLKLLALALDVSEPWLMGYDIINSEDAFECSKEEIALIQSYRKLTQPRKEKSHDFIHMLLEEQVEVFKSLSLEAKSMPEKNTPKKSVAIFEKSNGVTIYPNTIGAAAGAGTSHYADLDFDEIMIPAEEVYDSTLIVPMYVRGDSMEPKYYDGDIIWVDTHHLSIDVGQTGVFDTEHGRVVKKMGNGELISINRNYPDIELNEYIDFSTYGKVIDVIRREQIEIWHNARWV